MSESEGKVFVCRCEDVTLADVEHAISLGYADVEEVKRYTGFGTGPCQGKECLSVVAAVIASATGRPPERMSAFTARPPLAPTPLKYYAGILPEQLGTGPDADGHGGGPNHEHNHGGEHSSGEHGARTEDAHGHRG